MPSWGCQPARPHMREVEHASKEAEDSWLEFCAILAA